MTDEDYITLEHLLGKLGVFLDHKYCIVPGVVQDCYHIAIYDIDGNVKRKSIGPTLREAVESITPNT